MQGQVLTLYPNSDMRMDFYVGADFVGPWKHEDDQYPVCVNLMTSYVMNIVICLLHLLTKLQTDIVISSLEAEYIALSLRLCVIYCL